MPGWMEQDEVEIELRVVNAAGDRIVCGEDRLVKYLAGFKLSVLDELVSFAKECRINKLFKRVAGVLVGALPGLRKGCANAKGLARKGMNAAREERSIVAQPAQDRHQFVPIVWLMPIGCPIRGSARYR
jgi:hypothetical protein